MTEATTRFTFVSQAVEEDTFEVVRFRGTEGISRLYEFEITLVSEHPDIDLRAILRNPATLTIIRSDGDDRVIHGIPSLFEQLHEDDDRVFYRAVLVPRIWHADLYHENQLFLDKTVPDIIEEILQQAALTTDDYELRLTRSYPQWEYICQYSETDFDFMSRWMEREGIYYYFEQTEDFEKLIITDNSSSHENVPDPSTIEYFPPSSRRAREEEVVRELICRQKMLPRRVILRDYNYRRPDLELRGEADVDSQGRGNVYLYGEHFKTPEEGNELARIRAEEILCRERVFTGGSTVPTFCPGYLFQLTGYYRQDMDNQRLLLTEVEHQGDQSLALLGAGHGETGEGTSPSYVNQFSGIPADVQFRPERTTQKPRFFGTMNARVDATGDGQYAELDDEGRYRIRLPFDQSDRQDGRASRWVRMAQPYAGAEYGMHFPLHRGTEVLLTFIDGDPDRPIISAAVPNPETRAPVTSENQTHNTIRTHYGHTIVLDDGNPHVEISTRDGCSYRADDSDHSITIITPDQYMVQSSDTDQIIIISTPSMQESITLAHGSHFDVNAGSNYVKGIESGSVEIHGEQEIRAFVAEGSKAIKVDQSSITLVLGGSHQLMDDSHLRLWNGSYNVRIDSGQVKIYNNGDGVRLFSGAIHLKHGSKIEIEVGGNKITTDTSKIKLSSGASNVTVEGSKVSISAPQIFFN